MNAVLALLCAAAAWLLTGAASIKVVRKPGSFRVADGGLHEELLQARQGGVALCMEGCGGATDGRGACTR